MERQKAGVQADNIFKVILSYNSGIAKVGKDL